jgi:tetratricopeptide (TPR) repeat protein
LVQESDGLIHSRSNRLGLLGVLAFVGGVCFFSGVATLRADTVWTVAAKPGAKPFERPKVKIEGLGPAGLAFRSEAGRAAEPKPLKDIYRIQVDDETALNSAEESLVAQKWDDAVSNYQRALSATRKDWVKQYATLRLIAAAAKSGKFSAAATAYAAAVARDPKTADGMKPEIPANGKSQLPAAISAVKTALGDTRIKPESKNTLQAFLAELYIANGQLKEAEALGSRSLSPAPAGTTGGNVEKAVSDGTPAAAAPAVNKGQIDLKLQLAQASLQQKKYQEAIDAIQSVAAGITEPIQQANALFTIAEAKAGLAGNDAAKSKDAALAFMRVVAHFKNEQNAPRVAESLVRAGEMLEQAKLYQDALAAYESVQKDYKNSPQARGAATGVARVKKAIEAAKG